MEKLSDLFYNCAYTVDYKTVGKDVNYAFVEKGDKLLIYFQGSNSVIDWIRNFLFPAKPYKHMGIKYRVHRGFLKAWKEVEDIIKAKIVEKVKIELKEGPNQIIIKDEFEYKWKHITVIGYSHGGALAAFCHECVWYWRPDLRESGLEGYGFEAPRIYAGFKVKKALKERWKHFTIIRTNNDLVTHCPPAIFGFCHVSNILKIVGDISLVTNHIPRCIKAHYPQVVYDALVKYENEN